MEEKKNQDVYTELSKDTEDKLRKLWYDAPFGRDRTYALFKQKYPNDPASRRAIFGWMAKQEAWQIAVKPTMSRGTVRTTLATKLGSIQIDYVDFSSNPFNGYNCILNAVDVFSKKMYAYPAKGQTVENTIKGMETFLRQGMKCTFCQSDNGTSFAGRFPDWCKEHNIRLAYSKPHTPQSNGVIESKNGLEKKQLFQLMRIRDTNDWVSLLPQVISSINASITFATGKTPDEIEDNEELHGSVAARLQAGANKRYKGKGVAADLKADDYVRRRRDYDYSNIAKGAKVGHWSKEIYQIVKVVMNNKNPNIAASYKIKNIETDKVESGLTSRGALLKIPDPKEMEKMPERVVRPGPVNGDEWEVETILDRQKTKATRGKPGKVLYKVKWKGWSRAQWEPAENLNAPELILEYERAHGPI